MKAKSLYLEKNIEEIWNHLEKIQNQFEMFEKLSFEKRQKLLDKEKFLLHRLSFLIPSFKAWAQLENYPIENLLRSWEHHRIKWKTHHDEIIKKLQEAVEKKRQQVEKNHPLMHVEEHRLLRAQMIDLSL